MTYLNELEQALKDLPKNEQAKWLDHYANYMKKHHLDDWSAQMTLGEPRDLAEKVRKQAGLESAADQRVPSEPSPKEKSKGAVFLKAPLAFLMALVVLVILWLPTLISWLIMVAFIFVAAFVGIAGAVVIPQSLFGGSFYIGLALLFLGLVLVWSPMATLLSMKSADWSRQLFQTVLRIVRGGRGNE
ncbi:HAAS domain-containing protein [Fructobacillus papyrifericola]|uniref:DUF1700 domain-containing protein n=1 Tax=Fructobacillus papyrifericola TaxID=2713172 RepID=A0ABS5QTI0_9LACO|nr:DUF1700 domain-containing protein [Fructobacillus papyrifericola]MBS9336232.1 DUF1700 domain-containing protein [Fructobacillus papyrifericola]